MQVFHTNTNLMNRVSEIPAGDGIRDTWIEEGMDTGFCSIPTHLIDRIVDLNTGEEQIFESHNLIVIGFGLLVASLLKGDATFGFPIQFWAVGEGEGDFWDDLSIEARQNKSIFSLTQLYNEVFRAGTQNVFIDQNNDEVTGPTSRLEIRAVFGPDVVGELREFGLFGGDASLTLNSGIMIDHKAHTVININNTPGQQNVLIRALRLTL
jgi:hypothetical protein